MFKNLDKVLDRPKLETNNNGDIDDSFAELQKKKEVDEFEAQLNKLYKPNKEDNDVQKRI